MKAIHILHNTQEIQLTTAFFESSNLIVKNLINL
jgi:hypothetical protein